MHLNSGLINRIVYEDRLVFADQTYVWMHTGVSRIHWYKLLFNCVWCWCRTSGLGLLISYIWFWKMTTLLILRAHF